MFDGKCSFFQRRASKWAFGMAFPLTVSKKKDSHKCRGGARRPDAGVCGRRGVRGVARHGNGFRARCPSRGRELADGVGLRPVASASALLHRVVARGARLRADGGGPVGQRVGRFGTRHGGAAARVVEDREKVSCVTRSARSAPSSSRRSAPC